MNAAHERLGMVSAYLREAVRETQSFRKAGLAMAKATRDLANYLMCGMYGFRRRGLRGRSEVSLNWCMYGL